MNKKDMGEQLHEYLSLYPENATYFLDIISSALKNFKSRVQQLRDHESQNAVHNLFSYINTKKVFKDKVKAKREIIQIIDAVFVRYPLGICVGESQLGKEVFNYFVSLLEFTNFIEEDKDWVISCKGMYFYEWLKNLKGE